MRGRGRGQRSRERDARGPAVSDVPPRAELATITELAERTLAGQGGVVLVEGPAGIGKTRLTEAALAWGAAAGLAVAKARCGELERDFPFGVVRQLLEPLVAGLAVSDPGRSLSERGNLLPSGRSD